MTTKKSNQTAEFSPRKHTRRSRLLVAVLFVLVSAAGVTAFLAYREHRSANQKAAGATEAIRNVIGGDGAKVSLTKVDSKLGFSLQYDKTLLTVTGTLTDKTSVAEDKLAAANYTSLKAVSRKSQDTTTDTGSSLEVVSSADKNFFAKQRQIYGQDLTELQVTTKYFETQQTNQATLELSSDSTEQIGSVKYHKRSFQITDSSTIDSKRSVVIYTTVQNGRPYAVIIKSSPVTSDDQQAGFMQILYAIQYPAPDAEAILGVLPLGNVSLAAVEAPTGFVNAPSELEGDTALKIVAKRQPAVVRIGTVSCVDLEIQGPNGASIPNISQACGHEAGSGSIVSKDGIISTNGHVVRMTLSDIYLTYLILTLEANNKQPFQTYLQFLSDSDIMSRSEIDDLITDVKSGDDTAFEKMLYAVDEIPIDSFKASNRNDSFAVQLSDEPIKLNIDGSKVSIKYSDKNVAAKLIDYDFDPGNSKGGKQILSESVSSDVAILKMDGDNFPVVQLGNIDSLGPQAELTAIGFPGFVDGALQTKKEKTIPSATQGPVQQILRDSEASNRKLVIANLPIAQGNSGGPAFNNDGVEVGLTTYTGDVDDPESGKTKFSKVGILRDINDYKSLLSKNHMTLVSESKVTKTWDNGIDKFSMAHYKESLDSFNQVKKDYPSNYLAGQFINMANDKIARGEDLSGNKAISMLLMMLGVFAVLVTGVVFLLLHHFKKGRTLLAQQHLPINGQLPTDSNAYLPNQVMTTQPGQPYAAQQNYGPYMPPVPPPVPPSPTPPSPVQPVAATTNTPTASPATTNIPISALSSTPNLEPTPPPVVPLPIQTGSPATAQPAPVVVQPTQPAPPAQPTAPPPTEPSNQIYPNLPPPA